MPVQVLEHAHGLGPVSLVQGHGLRRRRRGLGAASRDHGRAGLRRRPGGKGLRLAPSEDGQRREADVFAVELVLVGQADVLQAVLQGEGAGAERVGARCQGMAGLVGADRGLGAAQHAVDAAEGRLVAASNRLARVDLDGEAVAGEGVEHPRGLGDEPVGDSDAQAHFAPLTQRQQHRQHHVQVLVDVDERQQER